jgi:hypothetical protein
MSCRLRAYTGYSGVAGVIYSYLIQAISRFFFSVLSTKYQWLTSFKTHYVLIGIHWIVVFLVALPAIITKDINFIPRVLCWVPLEATLHMAYTAFAYYILPVIGIIIIYIYIYLRIRRTRRNATITINSQNSQKRDLEILRYIVILLGIYLTSGIPTILFMLTSIKLIYLINLVSPSFTVVIEKLCTIILDREIRDVLRNKIQRQTIVMPSYNTNTTGTGR